MIQRPREGTKTCGGWSVFSTWTKDERGSNVKTGKTWCFIQFLELKNDIVAVADEFLVTVLHLAVKSAQDMSRLLRLFNEAN